MAVNPHLPPEHPRFHVIKDLDQPPHALPEKKRNPRRLRPGYDERFAARKRESAPANRSVPEHRGPSHRESGMDQEKWRQLMKASK